MLVCPNSRLTVSIGTPLDNSTVVQFVCLASCVLAGGIARHGKYLVVPCHSFVLLYYL